MIKTLTELHPKEIWMANKHMRSWSALLVIMEMQIEAQMKYHYTLLEWQRKQMIMPSADEEANQL